MINYAEVKPVKSIKRIFELLSDKKSSTLAGAISFFCALGAIPFAYLCVYFLSLLKIDVSYVRDRVDFGILNESIKYILNAASAGEKRVTFTFIIATLYSSSKMFFHILKSGEIIYGVKRVRKAFMVRVIAVLLSLFCVLAIVACVLTGTVGMLIFGGFKRKFAVIQTVMLYLSISAILLASLIIINKVVCPFKIKISDVFSGSLITLMLWAVFSVGFAFYCNYFADFTKTYGTAAFFIVFLFWVNLMSQAFVMGEIIGYYVFGKNETFGEEKQKPAKRKR